MCWAMALRDSARRGQGECRSWACLAPAHVLPTPTLLSLRIPSALCVFGASVSGSSGRGYSALGSTVPGTRELGLP